MKSARQDAQYWENSKDKKIDKINYPCHKEVFTDFGNNGIWRMQ